MNMDTEIIIRKIVEETFYQIDELGGFTLRCNFENFDVSDKELEELKDQISHDFLNVYDLSGEDFEIYIDGDCIIIEVCDGGKETVELVLDEEDDYENDYSDNYTFGGALDREEARLFWEACD